MAMSSSRGEKAYNGVAILSRLPLEEVGHRDFCARGDARHVAARLPSGAIVHNLYVPAGGDVPDPGLNPKFAHKLDFLAELRAWFAAIPPERAILVGDLNVAPRDDDVWNHKRLLKVVSHTPVEVAAFAAARETGGWVDVTRAHAPDGPLYSWWSYRAPDWAAADKGRRLDHVWATPDLAERSGRQPHRPPRPRLGEPERPRPGLRRVRGMIDASVDGPVARITLDRPAAHNALDRAALAELLALLDDWASRDDIRALVLTGRGRSFCAGASLGDVAGGDWSDNPLTRLCDALEAFPLPTVAGLNGGAYGGGVELALACDFRIGVEGMRAFVPPARLGIHYEPAGIRRAIDRLGSQAARRMFLLAESFDAEALLAIGFVDRLVAPDALDAAVAETAATLAGLAPLAVQGMKRTIVELGQDRLDEAAARARIAACFASADHAEGLAAQAERRAPRFAGR